MRRAVSASRAVVWVQADGAVSDSSFVTVTRRGTVAMSSSIQILKLKLNLPSSMPLGASRDQRLLVLLAPLMTCRAWLIAPRARVFARAFSRASGATPGAGDPCGTLFVVPTPLGNLDDMTVRALRTLREADVIAAEDTRVTGRLLSLLGVSEAERPRLVAHHAHDVRAIPKLLEELAGAPRRARRRRGYTDHLRPRR